MFRHDGPRCPLTRHVLAVLEAVIDGAVQHEFIAARTKGEDLDQFMLARLDGTGPQAVPQREDPVVPLRLLCAHGKVRVREEGLGVVLVRIWVVGHGVELLKKGHDAGVDVQVRRRGAGIC